LVKHPKHPPFAASSPREPQTQIKKKILMETRRLAESVEGLNSSLSIAAGELWRCKLGKRVFGGPKRASACPIHVNDQR